MTNVCTMRSLFILCFIASFTNLASAEAIAILDEDNGLTIGLRGKSFTVNFPMDDEEYTDILIFGSDGSFTMDFFSEIENSSGFYLDLLGIFFFANFSGSLPSNSFTFSFYGIYLNSEIFGMSIIDFTGSKHIGHFSGTEVKEQI
ncbi:MAG: hypothetical protein JRJ00_10570 [Deltaproteobacteria bacterium]|nr:hypothetical protein [Deltaproteobacteria bacterium]